LIKKQEPQELKEINHEEAQKTQDAQKGFYKVWPLLLPSCTSGVSYVLSLVPFVPFVSLVPFVVNDYVT
jgi:hypothetical protein